MYLRVRNLDTKWKNYTKIYYYPANNGKHQAWYLKTGLENMLLDTGTNKSNGIVERMKSLTWSWAGHIVTRQVHKNYHEMAPGRQKETKKKTLSNMKEWNSGSLWNWDVDGKCSSRQKRMENTRELTSNFDDTFAQQRADVNLFWWWFWYDFHLRINIDAIGN